MLPFDLHVLSIPLAFNLSQDQTLLFELVCRFYKKRQNFSGSQTFKLVMELASACEPMS